MKSYIYYIKTKYGYHTIEYNKDYILKINLFVPFNNINSHFIYTPWIKKLEKEIKEYFECKRKKFSEFPLYLNNLTKFEKDILLTLKKIPFGEIISYKKLGEIAGYPNSARAVGNVMKKNPFPLLIPCHRVIKSNGNIGNFSAGKYYKQLLLKIEGIKIKKAVIV